MAIDSSADPYEPSGVRSRRQSGFIAGLFADPLRLVLFMAVNLAIVVGFTATLAIYRFRRLPPQPATVKMALEALDRKEYTAARHLAERIIAQGDVSTEDWGGPDYVLGTFVARAADRTAGKRRIELFDLAARFLEESCERGLPKGREDEGLYMLSKCLCAGGRAVAASKFIDKALQSPASKHFAELRSMLVDSLLDRNEPDCARALSIADGCLADKTLTDNDRYHAQIQRTKVLLRMDRLKECATEIEKVPADASVRGEVSEIRGEMLYREAIAMKSANKDGSNRDVVANAQATRSPAAKLKLQQAIEFFRHVPNLDDPNSESARRALYLTGICFAELGDLRAAFSQFDRTCRLIPGSAEALAAALAEAEVARRLDRPVDALIAYRALTQAVPKPEELQNPWVSVRQLRNSLLDACQDYVSAGKYATAAELAKSLPPLFSQANAMEELAKIYKTWGQNLLDQADSLPPDRAELLRSEGRQQMRKAGVCYSAVAANTFTSRQFPEQLFKSAESYLAGNDFHNAVRVFEQYLHFEPVVRRAQVLVRLGDAQLSSGQPKEALESFTRCIEQHPRDEAVYRARLLASHAASVLGDPKKAAAFLQANLDGDLKPVSKEWRESLFALGELLYHQAVAEKPYNQGRYDEAIRRLDEALTRYPTAPQVTNARYLLADASRRSAAGLRAGLQNEISQTLRTEHGAEAGRLLREAADGFRQLRDALSRNDERDMTADQKSILRNSRFALGETLYLLGQYDEALRAYQSAANAYPSNPEVLEAFAEIANVYKRKDRPTEARAALEQARLALRRIPPQTDYARTTNYDRKQWGDMLDWMCNLQP